MVQSYNKDEKNEENRTLINVILGLQIVYKALYLNKYCFLNSMMSPILSIAHDNKLLMCGRRLLPLSVSEYSTRGGISGKASLCTNQSASRILRVVVNIFWEMSGISCCNSMNR